MTAPSSLRKANPVLTGLVAALVSFAAYTSIFCFRKAFNVAPFSGHTLFGLDYKIVLVITQVAGYMCSKFYGIRFISELKRQGRGKLILILVSISWLAWLGFALIPAPYNFWCLFFNGFPLGMLWGIVFSYVEGRRATDVISAALAVSFIFGSGVAKSVASFVLNDLHISEYWMPFTVGLIFMLPLVLLVWCLEKIPPPDEQDIAERMERSPMSKEERKQLLKHFLPGIILLVLIYIMVTILREVRDSFMADMWRESGEVVNNAIFAKTETIISLAILLMIAVMVVVKNNYRAFMLALMIMLAGFIILTVITMMRNNDAVSVFYWMTFTGLGLYMVYIPYNSILFERFIAAYRFAGNVGFLIYIADSFGYLGSVTVMLTKSVLNVKMQWLSFYNSLVLVVGVIGTVATIIAMIYFSLKKRKAQG